MVPSGMVTSWTKAKLSVQGGVAVGLEVAIGCGVAVGMTGVCPWTGGGRVAVGALGGMKGVGVGVGAQAASRRKANRETSRSECGLKRERDFICPRKNVGALYVVPLRNWLLFVGWFFVPLVVHDERHDQFAA